MKRNNGGMRFSLWAQRLDVVCTLLSIEPRITQSSGFALLMRTLAVIVTALLSLLMSPHGNKQGELKCCQQLVDRTLFVSVPLEPARKQDFLSLFFPLFPFWQVLCSGSVWRAVSHYIYIPAQAWGRCTQWSKAWGRCTQWSGVGVHSDLRLKPLRMSSYKFFI